MPPRRRGNRPRPYRRAQNGSLLDILHFDHVSMAVPELEPQLELLESLFGFKPDWEAPITQGDFR